MPGFSSLGARRGKCVLHLQELWELSQVSTVFRQSGKVLELVVVCVVLVFLLSFNLHACFHVKQKGVLKQTFPTK